MFVDRLENIRLDAIRNNEIGSAVLVAAVATVFDVVVSFAVIVVHGANAYTARQNCTLNSQFIYSIVYVIINAQFNRHDIVSFALVFTHIRKITAYDRNSPPMA